MVHFLQGAALQKASQDCNPGLHAVEPRCESSAAVAFSMREGIPVPVRETLLEPSSRHSLPCAQLLAEHPTLEEMYVLYDQAKEQPVLRDDEDDVDADEDSDSASAAKLLVAKKKKHLREARTTFLCKSRSNVYVAEVVKEPHVLPSSQPTEVRFFHNSSRDIHASFWSFRVLG